MAETLQQRASYAQTGIGIAMRPSHTLVATTRLTSPARSVFTKTESSASLDRHAKRLAASRRKVRACEPLDITRRVE
jgi:hypothetical protein